MKSILLALLVFIILFSGCSIKNYTEKECEDKSTPELKEQCYLDFAKKDSDTSYCNQLQYKSFKDRCAHEVECYTAWIKSGSPTKIQNLNDQQEVFTHLQQCAVFEKNTINSCDDVYPNACPDVVGSYG
ncbi:MAG: hypothetical protein V1494_05360 [Candidatus Diapherotrites archaeon]